MVKRSFIGMCIAMPCVLAFAGFAQSSPFDPEFEVKTITGTCEAKTATDSVFQAAAEGQKFAYGTYLRTDRNSSAVVQFSENNSFRILGNTTIAVTEDMINKKLKVLKLKDPGGVQVMLEPTFHQSNELKVETPSAVCGAVGCDFTVEYDIIAELLTTVVTDNEGEADAKGDYFTLSGITQGDKASIARSPDGKFIRIKIISGEMTITIRDTDGTDRRIALQKDDEVVIVMDVSPDNNRMLIILYKITFADPAKEGLVIQTQVELPAEKGQVFSGMDADWPRLTVGAPLPRPVSPTPVGFGRE